MPLLPDLSSRVRQPEMMDDPAVDHAAHRRALHGLERINQLSRVTGAIWQRARQVAANGHPLRVLDVATGGGDVPIALWKQARRQHVPIEIVGCDLSLGALIYARDRARQQQADVNFFEWDALQHDLPAGFDVVTCNLFLHHLDEADAVNVLAKLARATRQLVIVSDLERSAIGYGLAAAACRVLTRSPIVHHDGPASVRAAFTSHEARHLARRAGLSGAELHRQWPRRWMLTWSKS